MECRDSFVFYRSFFEAISELKEKDQASVLLAICDYALNGNERKLNGISAAMFMLMKPNLDANQRKYENGKKGGRPKTEKEPNANQNKTKKQAKDKQNITETEPNVDVDVNVDVNEDEDVDVDGKSAEPDGSTHTVATLPLNTGKEHPISEDQVREWSELYPAVDIMQELRSMRGWLIANPSRRKTKSGILRFVNNWLSTEQDRGVVRGGSQKAQESGNIFLDMLEERRGQ